MKKAFLVLKERLITAPILHHYEEGIENEVHMNPSFIGMGATLIHKKDGNERVVCFASRRTYDTETRYTSMGLKYAVCR